MARAVAEFGGLDIAVANAGIVRPKDFLELSEEDWCAARAWGSGQRSALDRELRARYA